MGKSDVFFFSCVSIIGGIFIRSLFEVDFFIQYIMVVFGVMLCGIFWKHPIVRMASLIFICLGLGMILYAISIPVIDKHHIAFYNEQKVEFRGVVAQEPDVRTDKVKYEVRVMELDNQVVDIDGQVLMTTDLYPRYAYGDELKIKCTLKTPEQIEDFAYDKYLARYGIYSLCYHPRVLVIAHGKANPVLQNIFIFKNFFMSRLNSILPEPHSSFLAGILIGARSALPDDLKDTFNKTGTTHIIAVSGYNVTIVVVFLTKFLNSLYISRKKSFWIISVCLIVFTIITGAQASIIRASIMGWIVLLALYLGRMSRIRNALIVTAVVMLVVNPKILVFDLGFQLSFLATIGLVYLNPILIHYTRVERLKSSFLKITFGDYLITTLSAIIITTPLILYNFGKISMIAPFANIAILPFIPIAMLLGFIAGMVALAWLSAGWVLSWSVWLVLEYIIRMLGICANFSWSYMEIEKIDMWLLIFLYGFLTLAMYVWAQLNKRKRRSG